MSASRCSIRALTRTALVVLAALSAALLASRTAHAQPPSEVIPLAPTAVDPKTPQGFSGKGQVGFVTSSGTTSATSANAKLDLTDISGRWKDLLHAETLYEKSGSELSAERWLGTLESQYQVTQPLFVFGQLMDTEDKFSGFEYQASATAGVGYHFLNTRRNQLSLQVGAGYRSQRPETLVPGPLAGEILYRTPLAVDDSAIGMAEIDAEHDFSASTKITEKALSQFGGGDTLLENDLALQMQMTQRLALSVGYTIQDNSAPPAGVKALETFTTLNLVFTL